LEKQTFGGAAPHDRARDGSQHVFNARRPGK
jgi:hypothetical protein